MYRWLFWICKSWRRFQPPRQELREKTHRRFCPQKDTPAVFFIPKIWTNIFMIFFWIWLGSFEWIENCLRKKEVLLCGKVLKLCHVGFLKMVYKSANKIISLRVSSSFLIQWSFSSIYLQATLSSCELWRHLLYFSWNSSRREGP